MQCFKLGIGNPQKPVDSTAKLIETHFEEFPAIESTQAQAGIIDTRGKECSTNFLITMQTTSSTHKALLFNNDIEGYWKKLLTK